MHRISAYILAYNEADKIADAVSSASCGRTRSWSSISAAAIAPLRSPAVLAPVSTRSTSAALVICAIRQSRSAAMIGFSASIWMNGARSKLVRRSCQFSHPPPMRHDAYLVPRRNFMMGRWIRGSGWYPNFRQPQLFRKGSMRYRNEPVHEGYELLSPRTRLVNLALRHLAISCFKTWRGHPENEPILLAGRLPSCPRKRLYGGTTPSHGAWAFIKHYLFKRGYRDGWAGFIIALGNFEGTFLLLREMLRAGTEMVAYQRARRCFDRRPQRSSRRMGKRRLRISGYVHAVARLCARVAIAERDVVAFGVEPPHVRISPVSSYCLASVLCPLPRRIRTCQVSLPRLRPPSRLPRPVGIRIATSEACSGYTHISAPLARSAAQGDLCHSASTHSVARISCLSALDRTDYYRGGILPPMAMR